MKKTAYHLYSPLVTIALSIRSYCVTFERKQKIMKELYLSFDASEVKITPRSRELILIECSTKFLDEVLNDVEPKDILDAWGDKNDFLDEFSHEELEQYIKDTYGVLE